jgi:hypothetical protein
VHQAGKLLRNVIDGEVFFGKIFFLSFVDFNKFFFVFKVFKHFLKIFKNFSDNFPCLHETVKRMKNESIDSEDSSNAKWLSFAARHRLEHLFLA